MGRDWMTYVYLLARPGLFCVGCCELSCLFFFFFFWQTQMKFRKVILTFFPLVMLMINSLSVHTFWICISSWSFCLISVQLLVLLCSCKSFIAAFLIHFLALFFFLSKVRLAGRVFLALIHVMKCYSRRGYVGAGKGWLCGVTIGGFDAVFFWLLSGAEILSNLLISANYRSLLILLLTKHTLHLFFYCVFPDITFFSASLSSHAVLYFYLCFWSPFSNNFCPRWVLSNSSWFINILKRSKTHHYINASYLAVKSSTNRIGLG